MSDTNPTPEVERLTAFVGTVRSALALGEDADTDAIAQALAARLGDAAAAVERVKTIEQERTNERIAATVRKALEDSGILPEFMDDALMRANAVGFIVNDKGEVVTKPDAANTIPSASPAAWVQGELKAKAARYWPTSQGGGSKGGGFTPNNLPGDPTCFDPSRPNLTLALQYEATFGAEAARRAAARYGVKLPGGSR